MHKKPWHFTYNCLQWENEKLMTDNQVKQTIKMLNEIFKIVSVNANLLPTILENGQ